MPVVYDKILKNKSHPLRAFKSYIIAAIPPSFLITIYFIFRNNKHFSSAVVTGFSIPARRFFGYICSFIPISVTELLYIAVGIFIITFLVRSTILIIKSNSKKIIFIKRILLLILIFIYYFSSFCFLWKFDYYSPTFAEKSGLSASQFTTEELVDVSKYFVSQASALASRMPRDENGQLKLSLTAAFNTYGSIYKNIQSEFACLQGTIYKPKQMYLFSDIMSHLGFTGIYVAYTGESNINIRVPVFTIPSTIAHEIAHQLGVYAEDEANFVGILACMTSENDIYMYSGAFSASIHLMNALYKVDKEAWNEIKETFSGEMQNDWDMNNQYWHSMESSASEAADKIYDNYLKANGQTEGIASYGQCVLLLVNYYSNIIK